MEGSSYFNQLTHFLLFLIIISSDVDKIQTLFHALSAIWKTYLIRRITVDISKRTVSINVQPRFFSLWIYPVNGNGQDTSHDQTQDTDRRNDYSFRLFTFRNYPNNIPSAIRLAQAGFYYNQNNDEVICYACDLVHSNWTSSDDPREVHLQRSPNCPHFHVQEQTIPVEHSGEDQSEERNDSITNIRNHDNVLEIRSSTGNRIAEPEIQTSIEIIQSNSPNSSFVSEIDSPYILDVLPTLYYDQLGITRHPDYITTESRRQSFQRIEWTSLGRHQTPQQMASSGFFYSGYLDLVRCFHCGIGIHDWDDEDDPFVEHARWSPQCAFIKKIKGISFLNQVQEFVFCQETQNELNVQQRIQPPQSSSPSPLHQGAQLGIPRHPDYITTESRRQSFQRIEWTSLGRHQTPQEMASAGFFYIGHLDKVRCFHCGIGLCNWDDEDDPFVEHARWSPQCAFIKKIKGISFVNLVQECARQVPQNELNIQQRIQPPPSSSPLHQENDLYTNKDAAGDDEDDCNWDDEDDPFVEHARWSPQCTYIKEIKGISFVNKVQECARQVPQNEINIQQRIQPPPSSSPLHQELSQQIENISKQLEQMTKQKENTEKELEKTTKENEELKELFRCKVCLENHIDTIFLPCGHLACCRQCAPALRKCPICRGIVKDTVRTFFP